MEICGKARQATDQNIVRRIRFECWIAEATHTLRILIAFPRQQLLRERALRYGYTCIASSVIREV